MSRQVHRLSGSWHDNAAAWTHAVRSGAIASRKVTDGAILAAILDRHPRKILDLGCGEGWLMHALADQGCTVVGIDGSAPLVAAAGRHAVVLSYADLIADPARAGEGFDLVVANFALLEEQIAPLLTALRRIMTADGALLVQTLHPLAAGPPYRDGWRTENFQGFGAAAWTPMPWYFRTLASWLDVLRESGFVLHGLREPVDEEQHPLSLLLEARAAEGRS